MRLIGYQHLTALFNHNKATKFFQSISGCSINARIISQGLPMVGPGIANESLGEDRQDGWPPIVPILGFSLGSTYFHNLRVSNYSSIKTSNDRIQ